jgi:hypothetical protein
MGHSPSHSFAEIADALLEQVRYDATMNILAEPFMASLPQAAPGLEHTWRGLHRRMMLIADGEQGYRLMSKDEWAHRLIISMSRFLRGLPRHLRASKRKP